MSDIAVITSRNVSLLETKGDPSSFRWVSQFMIIDQVPESIRDDATPFRFRLYDSAPTSHNAMLRYRTSVSVGDDVSINVFKTVDAFCDSLPESKSRSPFPPELERGIRHVMSITADTRRWVFGLPDEEELLIMLDVFRQIAPTSCACADSVTQRADNSVVENNTINPDANTADESANDSKSPADDSDVASVSGHNNSGEESKSSDANANTVTRPASQSQQQDKQTIFQTLFQLSLEKLVADFSCCLFRGVNLHGRVYITDHYVCFFSSLFGYRTKIKVALSQVVSIEEVVDKAFGSVLAITAHADGDYQSINVYKLSAFTNKDKVVAVLTKLLPKIMNPLSSNHHNGEVHRGVVSVNTTHSNTSNSSNIGLSLLTPRSDDSSSVSSSSSSTSPGFTITFNSPVSPSPVAAPSSSSASSVASSLSDLWSVSSKLPTHLEMGELRPPVADPMELKEESLTQIVSETFPLSVSQVWWMYFADNAPYSFPDYHDKVRGDKEIVYSRWMSCALPLSPIPKGGLLSVDMYGAVEGVTRDYMMSTSLKSPIGPDRVIMYKMQRAAIYGNAGESQKLVFNMTSTTPGAVFGENFFILERWEFQDSPDRSSCSMKLSVSAIIVKRPWKMRPFISVLTSRAILDSGKQYVEWAQYAIQFAAKNTVLINNSLVPPLAAQDPSEHDMFPTCVTLVETASVVTNNTQSNDGSNRADRGLSMAVGNPSSIAAASLEPLQAYILLFATGVAFLFALWKGGKDGVGAVLQMVAIGLMALIVFKLGAIEKRLDRIEQAAFNKQ